MQLLIAGHEHGAPVTIPILQLVMGLAVFTLLLTGLEGELEREGPLMGVEWPSQN